MKDLQILKSQAGMESAHLMEHLMSKNFEHLREDFEREGIDWNAYTSNNEIVFYFTGLEEYLSKRKYELIELMSQFNVTKEQFENEKNIVLQEYTDYFSGQTDSHMLNLSRKLFPDYDPIGLREDLESMKFMDVLNFFELQYANPSKIINVSPKSAFKSDVDFSNRKIDKTFKMGPYKDVILEKMNDFGNEASIWNSFTVSES
jgi:predicted Zn-dependent peptidase